MPGMNLGRDLSKFRFSVQEAACCHLSLRALGAMTRSHALRRHDGRLTRGFRRSERRPYGRCGREDRLLSVYRCRLCEHRARAANLAANRWKLTAKLRPERPTARAVHGSCGHMTGCGGHIRVVPGPGPSLGMVPGRWSAAQHHA